jgi:hypothetical protein
MPVRCLGPCAVALSGGALLLGLVPGSAAAAVRPPDFEAPFRCGQDWRAETRSSHSPSIYAVDFNRDDDYRASVEASAPGVVTTVADTGSTSYGKYIRVSHNRGWDSVYAHLDAQFVVVGQRVDQGAMIGLLGTSGGSTGPHLHFEQRHNAAVVPAVFHGKSLTYNTTIRSHNCGDVPIAGNRAGDRRTEVGVFRPLKNTNAFRFRMARGAVDVVRFGASGDLPVVGDWDGDGRTGVGVWNRTTRTFSLRADGGRVRTIKLGKIRDVPVTGDWNGNGRTDVGVFSPRRQTFRLRAADGSVTRIKFGSVGSIPVTGDWDGDGRTDVGVYDKGGNQWTLRLRKGQTRTVSFGRGGLPVAGDWNGDGAESPGSWSPSNAVFRLSNRSDVLRKKFGLPRR